MNEKKITSLRIKSKKRQDIIIIFFEEEILAEVYAEIIYKLGIKKGMIWDSELEEKIKRANDEMDARKLISSRTSLRPRTVAEIRRELENRSIDDDISEKVVDDYQSRGLLNDAEYSQKYVRDCIRLKGWGPYKIEAELVKRGIADDIIKTAIEPACDTEYQTDRILTLLKKKLSLTGRELDKAAKEKIIRFLVQRGFEKYLINKILCEYLVDTPYEGL